MLNFEEKALDYYPEVVIDKSIVHQAGFGARSIPTYVGEWILSHFLEEGELTEEVRRKISHFIGSFLPSKSQKDEVKNKLLNLETIKILDDYSVSVNLESGRRQLRIPVLDILDANLNGTIVDENPILLKSGVWGIGELYYISPEDSKEKGQIWMRSFKPFQIHHIDLEYYKECRKHFNTSEWLDFIISSMGFNPTIYSTRQKMLLITRIIPLVESRLNLIELAPKGTGKSFVFDNLSRYARVIGGGKITPAVLFYNLNNKTPGLITRYDVVVLDEVQSVQGDSAGELVAGLKVYLESGRFSRGNAMGTAEAGFVMLGNITLDENRNPLYEDEGLFKEIPNFLQETAFVDRIHGLLPGWELPRISKDTPTPFLGLKGDFFSEVLNRLRGDVSHADYVSNHLNINGCDDLRDKKAIVRLATGYMKILFPDLNVSEEDFKEYVAKPATEMRQRIRDELHKLDYEYKKVQFEVL